jgi:alpha-glucosidase
LGVKPLAAVFLLGSVLLAQDVRRIVSPDGQLEFRIFITQSERGGLSRLAYRVLKQDKPLVDTSFLGFNIHNQEPFLGENVGLLSSRNSETGRARCLVAHYMQNGSIGRLIDVEARVWNDGVAFRYVIPHSTALEEILIDDELTEFNLGGPAAKATLPFSNGTVWIAEVRRPPYPAVTLGSREPGVLTTFLVRPYPDAVTAFETRAPLTSPWRIVAIADPAAILAELRAER